MLTYMLRGVKQTDKSTSRKSAAPGNFPLNNGKKSSDNVSHSDAARDFSLERYRYILTQIHTVNENVYKFLALYQAIATAAVGAALALFVGYRHWGIRPPIARQGVIGLMWLDTIVAAFTSLLVFIGILAWLDYRKEECELTDRAVYPGFRKKPSIGNFFRWYETYILIFIAASTIFMWSYAIVFILPHIN